MIIGVSALPLWREELIGKTKDCESYDTLPSTGSERIAALDAARGAGILAVVCLHSLPIFLDRLNQHCFAWQCAAVCDALLMFAVPLFLILTTLLHVRKMAQEENRFRQWKSRMAGILRPYLFWSLVFLLIAWRHDRDFTWPNACFRLLTGKSYYHLYFLGLMLQLYLLLPLFAPLLRLRPKFSVLAGASLLLTLAFYAANRFCLRLPYVGSVILWYIPAVSSGLYLGSRFEQIEAILKRQLFALILFSAISAACYVPQFVSSLRGEATNTFWFQINEWVYTGSMALLVLALAFRFAGRGERRNLLQTLGRNSMPVYLLHRFPAMLFYLAGTGQVWTALPLYALTVTLSLWLPLRVKRKIGSGRLSVFLFGR